jgi:NitT/TauT family transport system permease protein
MSVEEQAPILLEVAPQRVVRRRPPGGRNRSSQLLSVVLPPVVLGIVIIGAWYFISYVVLAEEKRFLLRPLHQVIDVGFLEWENFSEILEALWQSTKVALIGLAISVAAGMGSPC